MEDKIYQNDNYEVVVGTPSPQQQYENPIPTYFIRNRKTKVVELTNPILYYALQSADELNRALTERDSKKVDTATLQQLPVQLN